MVAQTTDKQELSERQGEPDFLRHSLEMERIKVTTIYHNASPAFLYEMALKEHGSAKPGAIASSGALIAYSGEKTGRSPMDKRIIDEQLHHDDIWWGSVNIPLSEASFQRNLDLAIGFLNGRDHLFVVDGFACWDPDERIKVRIVCSRPYHALFMTNMLIRPSVEELASYGEPDWIIYNAGQCPADDKIPGVTSEASIDVNFKTHEFVILGTEYAGCMKKGVFTILNYTLPRKGILSMHCSANEGKEGDTALFFGLSGTGKTTLSADPERRLIGDDEHGWNDRGIFNIEGGCYAKTIHLRQESEPEIWDAIRFGSVLENVVYDPYTHVVDYDDTSLTENTRVSYPVEFMPTAKIPCMGQHPNNIIFLTCDAYGVLPAVSKLSPEQAMYHFISGYTAKVAGTEVGILEPKATFSACFGAAFLVWHPMKYAELLSHKMQQHNVNVWLVNTGWYGGAYGKGQRFSLKHTRAIVRAVLSDTLAELPVQEEPFFGLRVPTECPGVPTDLLMPEASWENKKAYAQTAHQLAKQFKLNFDNYADGVTPDVLAAGPKV